MSTSGMQGSSSFTIDNAKMSQMSEQLTTYLKQQGVTDIQPSLITSALRQVDWSNWNPQSGDFHSIAQQVSQYLQQNGVTNVQTSIFENAFKQVDWHSFGSRG